MRMRRIKCIITALYAEIIMYIHERKAWPQLRFDKAHIADLLAKVRLAQGRLLGRMEALGFQLRTEANLHVLIQDVLKTSEIEGEKLNTEQVRSSLAKRLGIKLENVLVGTDRHVEGIVDILLDATTRYDTKLTKERLFSWHAALFPTRSTLRTLTVGAWRTKASGPMQVVSGPYGRETVHYEAPVYNRLKKEMNQFLQWFNTPSEMDLVIKSALAHFWFVTIHPFDDGNGRIARAIADMTLASSEKNTQRFYSMSAQIQQERQDYYDVLERCQKGTLDITVWVEWFLNCLSRAILAAEKILEAVLTKARFWKLHAEQPLNDRQRLMMNRLLDNFYGKLNSSKWAKLAKCSQDTALRDINDLLDRQLLIKDNSGGRSTSYSLNLAGAMEETSYLLQNKTNAKRLRESISQAESGHLVAHDLLDKSSKDC